MRTTAADLDRSAEIAFRDACRQAGLAVRSSARVGHYTVDLGGHPTTIAIHGATIVTPDRVRSMTGRLAGPADLPLVVADKVLGDAAGALDESGWSWLDRRGRFHLRSGETIIDLDIDPAPRSRPPRPSSDALASRGAQELAVALLVEPDDPPGVRAVARSCGFAPSTISRALAELRELGLVRSDGRPVNPDLFWALAERWMPTWVSLATRLDPAALDSGVLSVAPPDPDTEGIVISDTRAALAWGAPVIASSASAASLYVPDAETLDRLVHRFGLARTPHGEQDRIAVAPARAVVTHRFVRPGERWPVVHPIVVALDLAVDRARGHQILDEWEPKDVARAW